MKPWLILLTAGMLTGCATDRLRTLPDWDIPEATETVTHATELPALPMLEENQPLSRDDVLMLLMYVDVAETNKGIADANANALLAQSQAYNNLIQAGKFMVEIAAIRDEMLMQERRRAFADRMFYRGIIVLGLAVGGSL